MLSPLTRKISQLNRKPTAKPDLAGALLEMSVPGANPSTYESFGITTEQLAAYLSGGNYAALTLTVAQALLSADPPAVVPNRLDAITGNWNATGTPTTVYVHGVRPTAYHHLGIVYDALGAGQLVLVDVAAGTWRALPTTDLLSTANAWKERQTFLKGLGLYNGTGFDEYGQLTIGQILLADKFLWRGNVQKMAKDVLVGWSPDEYAGQNNPPDVGLARDTAGVLEANTGTKGSRATILVKEVEASDAPPTLNTFGKIAAALGLRADLLTTAKTSLVAALNELVLRQLTPGWGMQQVGTSLGLLRDAGKIALPPGLVGYYLNTQDGSTSLRTTNVTSTPLVATEPGAVLVFAKPMTGFCWYDANGVFLAAVGTVSSTTTAPADAYFWRAMAKTTSGADSARIGINSVYNEVTYKFGSLPYVTGIQTGTGLVKPNALGVVDGSQLGGGGGGVTAAQLEAVRRTVQVTDAITADRAIVASDAGCLLRCEASATLTLPADLFASDGKSSVVLELVAYGAYTVAVAPAGGVTIIQAERRTDGRDGARLRLTQRATNTWDIVGGVL